MVTLKNKDAFFVEKAKNVKTVSTILYFRIDFKYEENTGKGSCRKRKIREKGKRIDYRKR